MRLKICVVLIILFVVSISALGAGKNKKPQTFPELCEEILISLQSFNPVNSTQMGVHAFDARLTNYSSSSVKQMISKLKQFESRLKRLEKTPMDGQDPLDYKLIKSNVDIALLDLNQIEWYKKSPQLYIDEAIDGIYSLMITPGISNTDKLGSIIARMKHVPELFSAARQNIRKPPAVWIQSSKDALNSGMEFYKQVSDQLGAEFPNRASEINTVSNNARVAMNDFITFLSNIQTGDDKSFSIGKTAFDYKLRNEYFLDFDSDSLLKLGESLFAQTNRTYKDFEKKVESQYQTGQDSVFVPSSFSRQDVLDYYQWEVNQIKTFLIMNNIVTVPDNIAPIKVEEPPKFLRLLHGAIFYQQAGPFDPQQEGIFYIRPLPDSMDRPQLEAMYRYVHRRGFKGSVMHEAFPGHHLQMQLAAKHPDPVHKWQMNKMFIEGWALYCEELMYTSGLFGQDNPQQWLAILGGIRYRAARIVADVKLHIGQFTYDECVDWMNRVLESDTEADERYIRTEVRRYTMNPTVQMSYLMGKREIMRLKEAAMKRDGNNFSEQTFHDQLLSQGSIPVVLMWQNMGLTQPVSKN